MVEKARPKVKGVRQSDLPLGALVDERILAMTGFNYAEPSLLLPRKNHGGFFRVYISDEREGLNPNIVIVEDQKTKGSTRWKEWYFGTFRGTPLAQRNGATEEQEYYLAIGNIIQSFNRVSGLELQERLKKFI